MKELLTRVRQCDICQEHLEHGVRPILSVDRRSKIAVIGQAPGLKVHQNGVPWQDASGNTLRNWLGVNSEQFYNTTNFAIVPMGFCYPGKGKSGDLPPRKECAPTWHKAILDELSDICLILLIGQYAQAYYLDNKRKKNLTATVRYYHEYLPRFFPLPHPSPRNRIWLRKNLWFENEVVPVLSEKVGEVIFDYNK